MKQSALSLMFLLLLGAFGVQAQTTVTFSVTGSQHSCNNVAYCIYTLSEQGNGNPATYWLYGAGWTQFGAQNGTLFCQPNGLNTNPYNPTANPIKASCTGSSPTDGSAYTLTLSANYKKLGCGRGGCWYAITGGTATLTASDTTISALGL